jgi:hypothetical protein
MSYHLNDPTHTNQLAHLYAQLSLFADAIGDTFTRVYSRAIDHTIARFPGETEAETEDRNGDFGVLMDEMFDAVDERLHHVLREIARLLEGSSVWTCRECNGPILGEWIRAHMVEPHRIRDEWDCDIERYTCPNCVPDYADEYVPEDLADW